MTINPGCPVANCMIDDSDTTNGFDAIPEIQAMHNQVRLSVYCVTILIVATGASGFGGNNGGKHHHWKKSTTANGACVQNVSPVGSLQDLERRLLAESPTSLARSAREVGDPKRGAIIFFQPYMACSKCHRYEGKESRLGPDLSSPEAILSDEDIVDAVLRPSKSIKTGFETMIVETIDGVVRQGTLVDGNEREVVMLDAGRDFEPVRILRAEIENLATGKVSMMPAGQVNVLSSRQQFLDLIRYLIEIRDGGVERARELEPPPSLYAAAPLPEYEADIDHSGMIGSLDEKSFNRGAVIYARICANCHGTSDQPGSLPTSLRFDSGKFKNGTDPFTMYQTLTRGFGMMVPQSWMVPEQKYDVIHFIREAWLKSNNPSQYFSIDSNYLDSLPDGKSRGPAPRDVQPWQEMDYGPNLVATYEIGDDGTNFAYKGNAVRLDPGTGGVSRGNSWAVFDFDTLRMAAAWRGNEFIDYNGINFNGQHAVHPRVTGTIEFANPAGPGWARPGTDSFDDPRMTGRDGRHYGPLPREWARYRGMFYFGNQTVVSYTVGTASVLEMQSEIPGTSPLFARHFEIGPRDYDLLMQVAHVPGMTNRPPVAIELPRDASLSLSTVVLCDSSTTATGTVLAGLASRDAKSTAGFEWSINKFNLRLRIPKGDEPLRFTVLISRLEDAARCQEFLATIAISEPAPDLAAMTHGGPNRWPEVVKTVAVMGDDHGPFASDVLTYPLVNPWLCRMRLTGHDFYSDGDRAAVCDWDGNVWMVSGVASLDISHQAGIAPELTWKRIASGLFQPLGLRIIDDVIHVTCRDQLCRLHDLNGDDAIDWNECVNNDHQVTEHFHEFAMGLQTDADGNFYYAKSARHALPALVPHHGTLLRIDKDGQSTHIIANGFRAANGVCLNPDGTFIVTDQEGHWNPKNRINWVKPGGFYGNMFGFHDITDESDAAMEQPLCWITNVFDRSPAELLWIDSPQWGALQGHLLNLSYGNGKVFLVPHESIYGQYQGGMIELPASPFPTGIIRGRFHPVDGQLYLSGMYSWAGNQQEPGGFFRLRYTGKPVNLPVELNATRHGIELEFTDELDAVDAANIKNYRIKVWDLERTSNYGSEHLNERHLSVTSAVVDGRRLRLQLPEIAPTWCMEIRYHVKTKTGEFVDGTIHNTIHALGTDVLVR